jgi:RNA polymerase sigma-70 factor (ECF subfamily)
MRSNKVSVSDATDIPTAFTTLVREYERPLYVFLAEMLDDAERAKELLQDTFVDAWGAYQRGTPPFVATCEPIDVRRWLFHIAYHRAVSVLRRRRLIHWESLESLGSLERSFVSDLHAVRDTDSFEDALAEHDLLSGALAHLSPKDVACLLLAVVHGFTAAETAEIMKAPPQAIAKRISRARHRLMTAYLKEYARTQEDERS